MPRFHFNAYDGVSRPDDEGTDLPDVPTARLEAIRLAGAILQDEPQHVTGEDWRVEVTDSTGLVLFRLVFAVIDAPVVLRTKGTAR